MRTSRTLLAGAALASLLFGLTRARASSGSAASNQAHADALAATGLCAPLCLADTVTP